MFSPRSRYADLPDETFRDDDGKEHIYRARRLPPIGASLQIRARLAPAPGERLDVFTARAMADPLLFWRIADANDALDPDAMMDEGRPLVIPTAQAKPR